MGKRRFVRLIAAAIMFFSCSMQNIALAAADNDPRISDLQLTIVSIPGFSFLELQPQTLRQLPHLRDLAEHGAIAAMNIRTPVSGLEDSYVTLGAGAPALSESQIQAFSAGSGQTQQPAAELRRFVGSGLPTGNVLIPGIERIRRLNAMQSYGAIAGNLGQALQDHGIAAYVFGNADLGEEKSENFRRYAPLMLMNEHGELPFGEVDATLLKLDDAYAFGVKTDYGKLLQLWEQTKRPSVTLIELGDLYRLYEEKLWYADESFLKQKQKVLSEIDGFLGQLAERMRSQSEHANRELWIFSPLVGQKAVHERLLFSPLLQYREAGPQGLIYSDTTRRTGIVTNTDFTATLLSRFSLPIPPQMTGKPIRAAERHQVSGEREAAGQISAAEPQSAEQLAVLLRTVDESAKVYRMRPRILYTLVTYEILVLLAALSAVLFKWRQTRWIRYALLSIVIAPAALLLIGYGVRISETLLILLLLVMIGGAAFLLSFLRLWPMLATIGMLSGGLLLLDGCFGAYGMQHSVLGYDAMIGARYYGIGNELMGVMIGAFLLGVGAWLQEMEHRGKRTGSRKVQAAIALLFLVVVIYMGFPTLGTNAGGAITAVVAFGLFWIRLYGGNILKEFSWKPFVLSMLGLLAAAVGLLFVLNGLLARGGARQSHIGHALDLLMNGKLQAIAMIMLRKLNMNLHLIGVSSWSKVLITSLLVMTVLTMRPRGVFRQWQQRIPLIMFAFSAMAVGSIVTLFVNDSGIVAASTMIVFSAVPMLLIKLQE